MPEGHAPGSWVRFEDCQARLEAALQLYDSLAASVKRHGYVMADPERVQTLRERQKPNRAALSKGISNPHDLIELDRPLWIPTAKSVYFLARQRAAKQQFDDPNSLLPIYVRLPEAEELYRKRHGLSITE